MDTTSLVVTTLSTSSYLLQQLSIVKNNETDDNLVLYTPSSVFFDQDAGTFASSEEEYFHHILMKYQTSEFASRTRLISVLWSATLGVFFILSTFFGIVGNLCVIIVIAGDKTMRRSAMNILLLNLAVADMLNLIASIPEWSTAVIYGYPAWDFPAFLCPLTRYLECAFLFASILTQLAVCIERYIAIVYPIHVRRLCTKTNILFLAATIWIVASIFSLPYALVHVKPKESIKCVNPYSYNNVFWVLYKWFEFLAAYAIPCSIMIFLYAKVATVLWSKNLSHLGKQQRPSALHANEKTRFEVLEMRRGIIKMLVVCVLVYFVFYSPIQGIFIMTAVFGPNSRPPYSVVLLLNALAVTCSSCNPLIYSLFSHKFRVRILHLLTCGTHGKGYQRSDVTYSFAKNPKTYKSCALDVDQGVLLQLTPDESPRSHMKRSNSPI